MNLDTRTVAATIAMSLVVISIGMFVTSRSYPDGVRRSATLWARASGLQAAGWILLGWRGLVPDLFSIVVANTLLTVSVSVYYHALKEFYGERVKLAAIYWPIPLTLAAFVVFGIVAPSYPIRVVLVSTIGAVQTAACCAILFTRARRGFSGWITGIGFALCSATLVVRVVNSLLDAQSSLATDLFRPSAAEQVVFLALFVALYMLSFGFLLMCNEAITLDLVRLATLDPLTEHYNRRTIEDFARREIARSRRNDLPMSIAMLDLDHFKRINDTFGHLAGDAALRHVVARIGSLLRADDLVGRYGGEEFIVVMANTAEAQAAMVAERLRLAIEQTDFVTDGQRVPLTASIGVASLTTADGDLDALVRRADEALYAAKAQGRNRVLAAPAGWSGGEPAA